MSILNKVTGDKVGHYGVLVLVFSAVFVVHFCSDTIISGDSMWSIHTSLSMIKEGNTDLDEYVDLLEERDYYAIEKVRGHYYTAFPVGASIVALPFVYVLDKARELGLLQHPLLRRFIQARGHQDPEIDIVKIHPGIELLVASFVVAVTAMFVYTSSRFFLDEARSLLITFVFAFCTSAWSVASRGLWQHGPSMLMLSVALYLILLAESKPWMVQLAGLPLAFSYVVRPTNSISVFLLTVYVFFKYRKYFFHYVLWLSIILVPFFIFNLVVYRFPVSSYYLPQRIGSNPHFFEALVGNLISPARGLFVFTPPFLFSVWGVALKIRDREWGTLDYFLTSIIVLHWISISSFRHWWGGHSFGPRLFSDMIPYFTYYLVPALTKIAASRVRKRTAFTCVFLCLVIVSFLIHHRGAGYLEPWTWNGQPVDIDLEPARLWDWGDIQFLRGM